MMIIPTLTVAGYITWRSRLEITEWIHNVAVLGWIMANATWMIGEMTNQITTLKPIAIGLFVTGLAILVIWYLKQLWFKSE